MSAPNTNIPKQKRRHRGPLLGIILGLVVVVLLIFWFTGTSDEDDTGALDSTNPDAVAVEPAPADAPAAPETAAPSD